MTYFNNLNPVYSTNTKYGIVLVKLEEKIDC